MIISLLAVILILVVLYILTLCIIGPCIGHADLARANDKWLLTLLCFLYSAYWVICISGWKQAREQQNQHY